MNTRCPPKRVPSAARFFTLCRLTVQPPQSYSVGGQRRSGQLTGKPAGARPDYRDRWRAVLKLFMRQKAPAALAAAPALPLSAPVLAPVSPRGAQGERKSPTLMAEEDALSIAASWDECSFPTEMEEKEEPALSAEAEPSSKVASEASVPVFELHVGTDGTRCNLFAGPLDNSG
ncbi:UNVERIFIED_CONTAM: hypothetical protein FKN15_076881 [Acipenser sinensis]